MLYVVYKSAGKLRVKIKRSHSSELTILSPPFPTLSDQHPSTTAYCDLVQKTKRFSSAFKFSCIFL